MSESERIYHADIGAEATERIHDLQAALREAVDAAETASLDHCITLGHEGACRELYCVSLAEKINRARAALAGEPQCPDCDGSGEYIAAKQQGDPIYRPCPSCVEQPPMKDEEREGD